jgi:carbamoyl-phosphate synthase large subunit
MNDTFNILITSAGRRVGLIEAFRQALNELDLDGSVLAVDCSRSAPAMYRADKAFRISRLGSPAMLEEVMNIIQAQDVRLLVPTIDPELAVYSQHRQLFAESQVNVAVSSIDTVAMCRDKALTNQWLVANDFPTVRQAPISTILSNPGAWRFPLIVKPRSGSASVGIAWASGPQELSSHSSDPEDMIAEEMASGVEHTINVFVDRKGCCRCAIPHRRIETRGGEVSKAVTVKHPRMMELGAAVAERLPGAYGALNIQGFLDDHGEFRITEINPRFGGGYPLAQRAGAPFTRWLIEETLGLEISGADNQWQDDVAMLRYDEVIYLSGAQIR